MPKFDPAAFLEKVEPAKKSGFDPAAFLDKVEVKKQKPEQYGKAQTALEHGANAASLGYLPQMQAMAQKPIYGALNKLTGQNVEPDDYTKARDINIERLKGEQEENPKTAFGSQVAGSVIGAAATPIPGIGASKGLLGALGRGASAGAAQGALQNPGDTKGEVNPLQLEERYSNAKKGAAIGGAVGGVAGVAGEALGALERAPEILKKVTDKTRGLLEPKASSGKIVEGLQEYESKFQFPKDSKSKAYIDKLIETVKNKSPGELTASEQTAVSERIGASALKAAESSGEKKQLASAVMSDISKILPLETAKAAGSLAKKYVGLVGAEKIAQNAAKAARKTGLLAPSVETAARASTETSLLRK